MVRPNQVIASDTSAGTLTFIMFGRSPAQAEKRVLALNFPGKYARMRLEGSDPTQYVEGVKQVTSGMVNRYAVTINASGIGSS